MEPLTSPVKAPFSSQWRSCPPTLRVVPTQISEARGRYTKGGQTIFSTLPTESGFPALISSSRVRAAAAVVFIFQLPATMGVRGTLSSELHQAAGVGHRQRQRLLSGKDTEGAG